MDELRRILRNAVLIWWRNVVTQNNLIGLGNGVVEKCQSIAFVFVFHLGLYMKSTRGFVLHINKKYPTRRCDNVGSSMHCIVRTRQIIRYRATATLRQPQIKQYSTTKEGGGLPMQRQHHIILTKSEAVNPMVVSENNSSSGMLII